MNNNLPTQPQPKSSKLFWTIIIVVVILMIAGGIWYFGFFTKTTSSTSQPVATTTTQTSTTAITNDTGLQNTNSDLDKTDLNSLDSALSQNDTDASQF